MARHLDALFIEGFKSIRSLPPAEAAGSAREFALKNVNLLIGPNGAGKSNFVLFFRMLRAMAEEGLARFVTEHGGQDSFFFGGPKETPEINARLRFGEDEYAFSLAPTASEKLMIAAESVAQPSGEWRSAGGDVESRLKKLRNGTPSDASDPVIRIHEAISSWTAYHFHDTALTAGMRREHSAWNYRELAPDASNIAPFLLRLREKHPDDYAAILETVRLVAPFLDDFLLEPDERGNDRIVRLEWRQKGSSFPFQPWQLSDGTLRFICLAAALLQPNPPSTIIIDEPELGLHPFALDVLAGVIRDAADRAQIIVSTQSAQLLNHFKPEEIVVVDREKGGSCFRRLEADALSMWTGEYSLGELWQKNVFDGGPSHE